MAVTTYRAANFQTGLTLNMPGGTGTGTSTWTLNQSTANLPSGTFRFIVYTDEATFATTKEICEGTVTGGFTVSVTARNAEGDTTAIDHPNGSIFAIVNTAGMENAQNDAIADLYLTGGTAVVTAGEAYAATTAVTNNNVAQAYSLPTLLQQDSSTGKWLKMAGTLALGARVRIAMAYEASAGDGSSVRIYLPGSNITVSSMSAELGRNFTNSLTSGACETTVLPPYFTYVGFLVNATTFKFTGFQVNNVLNRITTPVVAGEAFSVRDSLYLKASDGRAYKTDADFFEAGNDYTPLFAAQAASGAAVTVQAYTPGAYIPGFSGLTVGVPYYPSGTAGAITTTKGKYGRMLGYAVSSTEFIFAPDSSEKNQFVETVVAGSNWVDGQMLYQKKSDSRWYVMDTTVAESGICEVWGFAVVTHTGGAGSTQQVYLPGSVINTPAFFTAGATYYSTTSGAAYTANAIPGVDQFYRMVCYALSASRIQIEGDQTFFLPTGIQEKGYVGTGQQASGGAGNISAMGVNFKKTMVNTPSSITFTAITSTNISSGPTAQDINRFGFYMTVTCSATPFKWSGTYVTVGN